jgi:hypothetical protein
LRGTAGVKTSQLNTLIEQISRNLQNLLLILWNKRALTLNVNSLVGFGPAATGMQVMCRPVLQNAVKPTLFLDFARLCVSYMQPSFFW